MNPRNQAELVTQGMGYKPKEVTEKVLIPGIETLHERSKEDIGNTLANLMKSRKGITAIKYVVGSHIELTYLNS